MRQIFILIGLLATFSLVEQKTYSQSASDLNEDW